MRKNKKLLLASVAALGALAIGVGATSTFAWYTSSNHATVQSAAASGGSLSSVKTDLSVNNYTINLAITAIENIQLSQNDDGALKKGMYTNPGVRTEAIVGSEKETFVKAITISASWAVTPSDPADVAYLLNKNLTGATLKAENNAVLCNMPEATGSTACTGVTDVAAATGEGITIHVDASNIATLTVTSTHYVRIKAQVTDGEDTVAMHTGDKLAIAAAGSLTIG